MIVNVVDARSWHSKAVWVSKMPVHALFAASALASPCGGVPSRCSSPQSRGRAARPSITSSVSITGLLARQSWGTPTACSAILSACIAEKTNKLANVVPNGGKMRTALLRGTNQKRWEVHSSKSEQGQASLEEKTIQSSQEPNGPPVLTIIAGLLVILLVLWVLGSLVSWIVGLLFQ